MAIIAIIGRPNVGKSTLFNRLVGRRLALVDDSPGVTRDRRLGEARLMDLSFEVLDTAGLEEAASGTLEGRMREQTEIAIAQCDLVLFLVDARAGITPQDTTFADLVRRATAPVVLVANKAEGRASDAAVADAWSLGLGEPIAISAEHGEGLGDLRDAMVEAIGVEPFAERDLSEEAEVEVAVSDDADGEAALERASDPSKPLRVAIVGRPNAGKSTLVNRFLGEERLLTGPEAGITRDSISVEWVWRERRIKMFDTAGLRRRARIHEKLEKLSVADALRAVRFAEVVVVAIDATIPFERQDLAIADLVVREGRAPVVALMKWDLVEDRQKTLSDLREMAERLLPQARGLRTVPVSGETGEGTEALMRAISETHAIWNRRIPTAKLNQWLERTVARHTPPAVAGRRITLKYMTQIKSRPPTFLISTSRPDALGTSYLRFLTNGLRDDFGLLAVPIRITLKKPSNPFAGRSRRRS